MSGSPDLAVVIVDYNAGEHLLRCLASVFTSAGDATLEVLVVDNASGDGSARTAAREHPAITLIENPDNRGFAAAVNQGIRWSRAPFLFLLNPDAEVSAGTLGGLLKLAGERPRAGAIGPLVRNTDGSPYPTGRKFPTFLEGVGHAFIGPFKRDNRFTRAYTMADWDRTTEREVDWVSMSGVLIRRAALEQVGLLDEGFFLYGEELDFCTRLRKSGWTVVFTPEVELTHAVGVSTAQVSHRWKHRTHSRSIYRYFKKHRATGWRRVLLPFAWVALRVRAELAAWRLGR